MRSFLGERVRGFKDHIGSQWGGQDEPKKDRIIYVYLVFPNKKCFETGQWERASGSQSSQ